MKTSLEFITMELEYKRIMLDLKSTELEKLKVKMDELQVRYKYEVELRNQLFNLLFNIPKEMSHIENEEDGTENRVDISRKGEERAEKKIEKRWNEEHDEKVADNGEKGKSKVLVDNDEEVIDDSWIEGYDDEENWEFEGRRLPMDNVAIAQLKVNRDIAILRYYSMKSSVENTKSEVKRLKEVLLYLEVELKESEGNKKRYRWLN